MGEDSRPERVREHLDLVDGGVGGASTGGRGHGHICVCECEQCPCTA